MQPSTRAFIKRGGAVCAAAAVFLGGTFTAGAATASPSQDIEPNSISSAVATATATPAASPTDAALPAGLAEAVERDLDISMEEFNKRGALSAQASKLQTALSEKDPAAVVSVDKDTVNVKTADPEAAKNAAAEINIDIQTPADPIPAPTSEVSAEQTSSSKPSPVPANSVDALLTDYIAKFGASKLQAVMFTTDGRFVIRTGEPAKAGPAMARSAAPAPETTPADFVSKYSNVDIETVDGPAAPYVDVVNGQGYLALAGLQGGSCSIGWNGFNPAGLPAIISAGHCTFDGTLTDALLTDPQSEPAGDGTEVAPIAYLGKFGFSQFGGPDNTTATAPPGWDRDPNKALNIGTDVAVIDSIGGRNPNIILPEFVPEPNPEIVQFPWVTNWDTPEDPKAAGSAVTGVSDAVLGALVCKSGRTTGWTCGTVSEVGAFLVGGYDATLPEDVRAVRGFGSADLIAEEGDSGGAMIVGNVAVGMISAGPGEEAEETDTTVYGVSLTDALSYTGGYSIQLALTPPTINTTAPVYRTGTITGTAPGSSAGATVDVSVGAGPVVNVPVAADGTWSAPAPSTSGTVKVSAVARNGFNASEPATASLEILKRTLPAPAIMTPANAGTVGAPVNAINGTGTAGATVAVEIADGNDGTEDITGTALVGADGNWSVAVNPGLAVGNYTATAQQTQADWIDSPTATSTFVVVYAAPAIVSPANGAEFAFNAGPAEISGTNVDGAAVVVTVNGTSYNAVVTGTAWTVALNAPLASGAYALTAVQSLNGVSSLVAESSFTVLAAPAPAPVEMNLANTGTSGTTVLLAVAGGLVLLGGAAFLLIRRRGTN